MIQSVIQFVSVCAYPVQRQSESKAYTLDLQGFPGHLDASRPEGVVLGTLSERAVEFHNSRNLQE